MEPDRFDDVAYTVVEEPESRDPRSGLRRRVAAVLTAAIIGFGGLAAAADALTDTGAAAAPAKRPHVIYNADGVPTVRSGPECREGKGHHDKRRSERSSAIRY